MSAQSALSNLRTGQRVVVLPENLCTAAEQRFGSKFGSITDLLTFVLTELLSDEAAPLDESEQKAVEQRLKDLGYI
jgi:hypothetical protein